MSESVKSRTVGEMLDVEADPKMDARIRTRYASTEKSGQLSPHPADRPGDPDDHRLDRFGLMGDEMKLTPYLKILWRWKWVLLITLVSVVGIVTIGTLRSDPVYTVSTTLRMRTTSGGSVDWINYDIQYAERLMNTYAIIATSGPMLSQLEDTLGEPLPDHVEAEIIPETELMSIRVDDTDPVLASNAANFLAAKLVTLSKGEDEGQRKPVVDVLKERLDELDVELKEAREEYRELVGQNPGDPERLTAVSQSLELKEEIYTSLLRQYEDARIREAIQVNSLYVVEPATPPESPARPRLIINIALGLLGGLAAGVGLAILFEKFTNTPEVDRD